MRTPPEHLCMRSLFTQVPFPGMQVIVCEIERSGARVLDTEWSSRLGYYLVFTESLI